MSQAEPATSIAQSSTNTTTRHVPALDGLRGVAILLVLSYHLLWSNSDPSGGWLVHTAARVRSADWIGVDLFFVLSGFLITGILCDELGSSHFFRNFYGRRSLRIFPLYYGFLLLLTLLLAASGQHWLPMIFRVLTYTQNLSLAATPEFSDVPWININHFWSLAIEEQFYLVWPVLIYFLKTPRRIAGAALSGIVGALFVRLALFHLGFAGKNIYVVYSWTPARVDALLMGALLAAGLRTRFRDAIRAKCRPTLLLCGCLWTGIAIRYGGLDWQHHWLLATFGFSLLALTFACVLAICLTKGGALARLLSSSVLNFFGRYSYGLYVYHLTLFGVIALPLRGLLLQRFHSRVLAVLLPGLVTLTLSTTIAWLSFHLFEKQFLKLKSRFGETVSTPRVVRQPMLSPRDITL